MEDKPVRKVLGAASDQLAIDGGEERRLAGPNRADHRHELALLRAGHERLSGPVLSLDPISEDF